MAIETEKPVALDVDLVQEFVRNAHANLKRVKELLAEEPNLVNASFDWGGGDWETGLGSAAHMGSRDIAEYLLEHGARMDIFAAAMLGKREIVKSMLEAQPGSAALLGPHGIPLLAHAKGGGEKALAVVAYLESKE